MPHNYEELFQWGQDTVPSATEICWIRYCKLIILTHERSQYPDLFSVEVKECGGHTDEHHEEVSHTKVDQEPVCACLHVHIPTNDCDHKEVAHNPCYEDDNVEQGEADQDVQRRFGDGSVWWYSRGWDCVHRWGHLSTQTTKTLQLNLQNSFIVCVMFPS